MSPGWVRTQVRTHSDFCWTRGLGLWLWPTGLGLGLGLWSNGLGLGLGLWSNGLGLTPDGLGLWPDGLGLGLGLWPCGLGLTAGLMSPDSLQHCLWDIYTLIKSAVFKIMSSYRDKRVQSLSRGVWRKGRVKGISLRGRGPGEFVVHGPWTSSLRHWKSTTIFYGSDQTILFKFHQHVVQILIK